MDYPSKPLSRMAMVNRAINCIYILFANWTYSFLANYLMLDFVFRSPVPIFKLVLSIISLRLPVSPFLVNLKNAGDALSSVARPIEFVSNKATANALFHAFTISHLSVTKD